MRIRIRLWTIIRISLLITLVTAYLYSKGYFSAIKETTFGDLKSTMNIEPKSFGLIEVYEDNQIAYFYPADYTRDVLYLTFSKHDSFHKTLDKLFDGNLDVKIRYLKSQSIMSDMFSHLLEMIGSILVPIISTIAIFFIIMKIIKVSFENNETGTNLLSMGDGEKSFYTVVKDVKTRFEDVVGQERGKQDLSECVNFFKHREQYLQMGYKIPKGILFVGPPGTGKTLMAKAFAGESGTTFISVSGSDFVELFVGMGTKRIRSLFEFARKNTPAVIFIDEIDSIGTKRGKHGYSSHDEKASTLNKLLTEMDGFSENDQLMVLAATNRPDILDKALTRSGRFDKEVVFDPPNKEERIKMFKLYLAKVKVSKEFKDHEEENLQRLTKLVAGMTGADIANIVNQSVQNFLRTVNLQEPIPEEQGVRLEDLEKAIDIVAIGDEKRERKLTEKELEVVAHHEAGHAIVAYMMKDTDPPIKISIIPRGRSALGFTQQEPTDQKIFTKEQLFARVCVLLGGRVAEEVVYNHKSTGASDDIEKLTALVKQMICQYGMGSLGPIKTAEDKFSEQIKKMQDEEIIKLIANAEKQTKTLLEHNLEHLHKVSKFLRENEVMLTDQLEELLGETGIKDSIVPDLTF